MSTRTRTSRSFGVKAKEQVERELFTIVSTVFKDDPDLKYYVSSKMIKAGEVLNTRNIVVDKREDYVRVLIPSAENMRMNSFVVQFTLDGKVRTIPKDTQFYTVTIGKYGMKCNCYDAIQTSAKAENTLQKLGYQVKAGSLAKYTFCKHTIAGLIIAVREGVIDLRDPSVKKTIKMSLLSAYLRVKTERHGKIDRSIVNAVLT